MPRYGTDVRNYGQEYHTTMPLSLSSNVTNQMIGIKSASGGLEGLGLAFRALDMENSKIYGYIMTASRMVKFTVGILQMVRGVLGILKQYRKYLAAKAAAETSAAALRGPAGLAMIAFATGVSVGVGVTLAAMSKVIRQDSFNMNNAYERDVAAHKLNDAIKGA